MAEFVEKRCEDMILELEQMERIKLFDKNEVKSIAKKRKEHEYKIERHTKCKEDYLRYIQYEMDLLKLVKQRRDKFNITQKKSNIDYSIANRINRLYRQAIFRFQDDVRFWIAYMKFCKSVGFKNCVSGMLGRMLQVHQEKPKCWHIAAQWEKEECKDLCTARQFLLRGLHFHPNSTLLYLDMYKLELEDALSKNNSDKKSENTATTSDEASEMPSRLKRPLIIFNQAFKRVKDIKFVVEMLNLTKDFENTGPLQAKIVSVMVREYADEPLMWDTMARRELEGIESDDSMEIDVKPENSLRDRMNACNDVYQIAVKKLKNEEMWSLYLDCLLEINQDTESLPNFKRKLLKSALLQGHQAKKLSEQYYIYWIDMLKTDMKDENLRKKLGEVLTWATEAVPNSEKLWCSRYKFLLTYDENLAATIFIKASEILKEKSLPLWRMKMLHLQLKSPEKIEEFFQTALVGPQNVADEMKPTYLEWAILTKSISKARKIYNTISVKSPFCLKLHKTMLHFEEMQPEISLKDARQCLELAVMQFGKKDVDLWMRYIKFEMKDGDPSRAAEIHKRAIKTLDSSLTDKFTSVYTLFKADPSSLDVTQSVCIP